MSLVLGRKVDNWRAAWAWTEERGGPGLTVRRFRRTFELDRVPEKFIVAVSADSRYRLWVNERLIGRGPLKGTLNRYHYEVYDLAPHLTEGRNAIAADVHWFGEHAPTSEVHSGRPGFLLQGPEGTGLDTPGGWKVQIDRAIEPDTSDYIANAANFLGYWERVDTARLPLGWTAAGYDDSDWEDTVATGPPDVNRNWGEFPVPELFPRDVPLLTQEPRRFVRTIRDHEEIDHRFEDPPMGWRVPAGESGEIILDAGVLTTGYPVFSLSGGAGRTVEITYSECMFQPDPENPEGFVKDVRDDFESGAVRGYRDTLTLSGETFAWEPFHWRTFWFIRIAVSAGEEPFELNDAFYRFTTFPQQLKAEFGSSDPDSAGMMDRSWRTLQLCTHETYEDCPYYEQLQYVGDTRLEALCSMALAGESRMARRAIRAYAETTVPSGLTLGRSPTRRPQLIPYFSLLWVLMVDDYWEWVGPRDADFVTSVLPQVDGVLCYFRERLRDDGFTGPIEQWNMVDRASDWLRGEPPAVKEGGSTYLTGLFVCALDAAVRLHRQAGTPADADRWEPLADELRGALQKAWSEQEGLFLEGPDRLDDTLSQHSQIMAILSGAASQEQTDRILERLTDDPALHRTKLMQSFYLARALEAADAYDRLTTHVLGPWREMLGKRLSTWCEYWPGRSDCHAWSSWIAHDFVTRILGVRPGKPGFEEVLIRPHTASLEWARGRVPTPHGAVEVDWQLDPDTGETTLEARCPEGVPAVVELPGRTPQRLDAGGRISVP
ncbi:MAG: alpha-L-rhamnosidase C-terminal domain-containing protein [Candidatus Brocadiia bacterium]